MRSRNSRLWPLFFLTAFLFVPKTTFAADWVNVGFTDKNVKTVFADPKNNQHIIVSLVSYLDNNYNYYTENGGTTWQAVSLGGPMTPCNNFAVNPKGVNEIWAGCNTGLFRSFDGGKNFTLIDKYKYTSGVRVSISTEGVIYMASTGNNLHKSVDGIFWEVLNAPGESSNPMVFLNKYNLNEIYVSAMSSGLYKSSDTGTTWTLVNNTTEARNGIGQMIFDSTGKVCASATNYGIGCSLDGGFTWSAFVSPNLESPHEYQHSYFLTQNPDDDKNLLVLSRTWGGLDEKIYSYETDSVLPKVTAVDRMFSGINVSQGVVFAWSMSASWTQGLWRNDGIAVVPEYLKKHPVIIVPGFLGSWSTAPFGDWDFEPLFNTYTSLYNSLSSAGYEPDKYLFKFPYQWRSDNRESAYLLKQKINEAKAASGASKVDIVAHSMGGIVTRVYAESDQYQNDIDSIVFIGTPQLGTVKSYPMWEAADLSYEDPVFSAFLHILLKAEASQTFHFGNEAILNYIHDDVPSIQQLLPIYSYISGRTYPSGYPKNEFLEQLDLYKYRIKDRGINVTNIVNFDFSTLSSFDVSPDAYGNAWFDGKPLRSYYEPGDETVLINSSMGVDGTTVYKNHISHTELPKNSIPEVFSALGIEPGVSEITESINKYLFIAVYSPVDFYVLAPDGKKIGFNQNGESFNEIDGAFYTGNDSDTEFVTIPNPLPGEYKVVAYGTESGGYEIEATYADDETENIFTSSYKGQTVVGEEDNILVDLDIDEGSIDTKIDDKTAPTTTAVSEGNIVNEYYTSEVIVTLTADDTESGVAKTEYSFDGVMWQDYIGPIVINQDGENTIIYRSVDIAGNVEVVQSLLVKIDKTAPLVDYVLEDYLFTHWDSLDLNCSATDDYSGIKSFTVKLDGLQIDCSQEINLFDQNLGEHTLEFIAIDHAGNITIKNDKYLLVANYMSTIRDISWLYSNRHFKSRGDAINIAVHIETAWFFDIISFEKQSVKQLEQAKYLLEKQFIKNKVSGYGYDMIIKDINYILEG